MGCHAQTFSTSEWPPTCSVFLCLEGFGTWENEEMRPALNIRANRQNYRVILVLLPDARLQPSPRPGFQDHGGLFHNDKYIRNRLAQLPGINLDPIGASGQG